MSLPKLNETMLEKYTFSKKDVLFSFFFQQHRSWYRHRFHLHPENAWLGTWVQVLEVLFLFYFFTASHARKCCTCPICCCCSSRQGKEIKIGKYVPCSQAKVKHFWGSKKNFIFKVVNFPPRTCCRNAICIREKVHLFFRFDGSKAYQVSISPHCLPHRKKITQI